MDGLLFFVLAARRRLRTRKGLGVKKTCRWHVFSQEGCSSYAARPAVCEAKCVKPSSPARKAVHPLDGLLFFVLAARRRLRTRKGLGVKKTCRWHVFSQEGCSSYAARPAVCEAKCVKPSSPATKNQPKGWFFASGEEVIIRFAQLLREGITNPLSHSPHANLCLCNLYLVNVEIMYATKNHPKGWFFAFNLLNE